MIINLLIGADSDGYRLTLKAFDQTGATHTLTFGVDPSATYGYDSQLGEQAIPPSPPIGIFDFRFKDIPGRRRIPSEGCYTDIRQGMNSVKCDTFVIYCQPSNQHYPMTISLQGAAEQWCDSIIVETTLNGKNYRIDLSNKKQLIVYSEEQSTQKMFVYSKAIVKNQ